MQQHMMMNSMQQQQRYNNTRNEQQRRGIVGRAGLDPNTIRRNKAINMRKAAAVTSITLSMKPTSKPESMHSTMRVMSDGLVNPWITMSRTRRPLRIAGVTATITTTAVRRIVYRRHQRRIAISREIATLRRYQLLLWNSKLMKHQAGIATTKPTTR